MKYFFIVLITFTVISCGSVNVARDYDEKADFSSFKTYNYLEGMQSGLNQLDLNRLMKATDSILQAQGYTLSENPGLLIDISSNQYQESSRNSVGLGVGGGSGNVGLGIGGGIPIGGPDLHQTITINIVDAEKDALIWQTVSDSNIRLNTDPQQRQEYFNKLAAKIFKEFPPKTD